MTKLSSSNEWATPRPLVRQLSKAFGPFDLDAAAAPWNAVCRHFVSRRDNLLRHQPKAKRVWLNPPYSRGNLDVFVGLARELVLTRRWQSCTLLVPHYTADGWWRRHVVRPEGRQLGAAWLSGRLEQPLEHHVRLRSEGLTIDIIEVAGRVSFRHASGVKTVGARHASAVVVFSRP